MKNNFKRIISALLAMALLASAFAVFASAEDTSAGDNGSQESLSVIYNRHFADGWDVSNGATLTKNGNTIQISNEVGLNGNFNYYADFISVSAKANYATVKGIGSYTESLGKLFIEVDIKSDDYCTAGVILNVSTVGGATETKTFNLISVSNNVISLVGKSTGVEISEVWTSIRIVLEYTKSDGSEILATAYYNNSGGYVQNTFTPTAENGAINTLNFGMLSAGTAANRVNANIAFDNLQIYTGVSDFTELPSDNYGYLVNEKIKPDMSGIKDGSGGKSKDELLEEAYMMKIGVEYAYANSEKVAIFDGTYGAPTVIDGNIMVPILPILNHTGYPYYVHPDGYSYDISTDSGGFYLKVGRDIASYAGETVNLTAKPAFITAPDGETQYLAVALDDIETILPGWYVTYDDMGLIIIAQQDDIVSRESNLIQMLGFMRKFIYDFPTAQQVLEDGKETTNNFEHPYIYGNAEEFKMLENAYYYGNDETSEYYNPELYSYVRTSVNTGISRYNQLAKYRIQGGVMSYESMYLDDPSTPDVEARYDKLPVNDYTTYDPVTLEFISNICTQADCPYQGAQHWGYDCWGQRCSDSQNHAQYAREVAFAYAVTKNLEYAKFTYDYMVAFGQWEHWGPAHMLDAAGATGDFALALDWIYTGVLELAEQGWCDFRGNVASVEKLEEILFTHGVRIGYRAVVEGLPVEFPRDSYDYSNYSTAANNWASVCTSGMGLGCMALMGVPEYQDYCTGLLSRTLYTLPAGCESLNKYAPDGSYDESPNYWAYGTNNFFEFCTTLESVFGTEYGLMDTWGMDKTCYYACGVESSDYIEFNYHDANANAMDTSFFFGVGRLLGDEALIEIRRMHIANGKSATIYDCLNYIPANENVSTELPLDYTGYGIDLYTTRSSWDKGALFAGMIGFDAVTGHGHLDTGTWVYHNKGVVWIGDLGMENYNVYGDTSDNYRYRYYRLGAEGHNTFVLTSQQDTIPYGHSFNGYGTLIEQYSDEYGSYVKYDNSTIYEDFVMSARRGMLLTHDRSAFVIQDEITFDRLETGYWFAHTQQEITISKDGKTAYLSSPNLTNTVIRATIISPASVYKFEEWDVYTNVLDITLDKDSHLIYGGDNQNDRSKWKKLVVKCDNRINFNFSVVFDVVDVVDSKMPLNYEWAFMDEWAPAPTPSEEVLENPEENTTERDPQEYNQTAIFNRLNQIQKLYESGVANGALFNGEFSRIYMYITEIEYTVNFVNGGEANIFEQFKAHYETSKQYRDMYSVFANGMNGITEKTKALTFSVT